MRTLDDNEVKRRYENVWNSTTFKHIADTLDLSGKRLLDLGCGFGEYMQRAKKGSVGITTTPSEVVYGKRHNVDIRLGNVEKLKHTMSTDERFDVFWANNLFEHLLSPHSFLVNLKQFAKPDTLLVLGVPMVPRIQSLMKLKKFRGALASPHINFFNKKTFELTARYAGWDVQYIRPFIFNNSTLDGIVSELAPHLYLVARNNPNYSYPIKKLKEWENDPHYHSLIDIMNTRP